MDELLDLLCGEAIPPEDASGRRLCERDDLIEGDLVALGRRLPEGERISGKRRKEAGTSLQVGLGAATKAAIWAVVARRAVAGAWFASSASTG